MRILGSTPAVLSSRVTGGRKMLNILSLQCGLAFAPYLVESISAFLNESATLSRVVRQGGSGLIIRSDDRVTIRHQNRQAELGHVELQHYLATVKFRADCFQIKRTSNEVVLADFDFGLLISHPQSDLWLDARALQDLLALAGTGPPASGPSTGLPEWLSISTGAGQLLISDQRNGRWVLLGSDHIAELERRATGLGTMLTKYPQPKPPTIQLKGVTIHLQSAESLLRSLETLGEGGEVQAFEEIAPLFSLRVTRTAEGIELKDSNSSVGINAREARKWTAIIRGELEHLGVRRIERGLIRTVFADGEDGRWVLQWGDEILIPSLLLTERESSQIEYGPLTLKRADGAVLVLSRTNAACIRLTSAELATLAN
jgi:hypothetical protein